MTPSFTNDFDFTITDVLLAHRFCYANQESYNVYSNGRKASGIVYCLSGNATYCFGSNSVNLLSGKLLFLPATSSYTVHCFGNSDFEHLTVNFQIPKSDCCKLIPDNYLEIVNEMVVDDRWDIKNQILSLVEIWKTKKRGYRVLSKSIVYEIVYRYFILLGKKFHSDAYEKIKPAKNLLDEQYTKNIPVSDLASLCGFSETHFRRLFTNVLHCSPTEYRLNKCILQAKDLLITEELSVSEVANLVGFEDANYFSRIFKSYTGTSPSLYAKSNVMKLPHC